MLQKYYYYKFSEPKISDWEYDEAERTLEKLLKENPKVKLPKWKNVTIQVDAPNPKWIEHYNMKLDKYIQKIGAWKYYTDEAEEEDIEDILRTEEEMNELK